MTLVQKHEDRPYLIRRHHRVEHRGEDFQTLRPERLQQHHHQPEPIQRHGEDRIVGDVALSSGRDLPQAFLLTGK